MSDKNKLNNKSGSPKDKEAISSETTALVEGKDYYMENGLFVLTEAYLKKRGYCCNNGCRHCPYKV